MAKASLLAIYDSGIQNSGVRIQTESDYMVAGLPINLERASAAFGRHIATNITIV